MSEWSFVLAAYGLTLAGTAALILTSWRAMRHAERAAQAPRR